MKLRVDIFLARALRWMSVSSGDELSCISSFSLFKAYCGGLSRRIFHVVIKNYRSTDQSPLKIRFTKKYLGFFLEMRKIHIISLKKLLDGVKTEMNRLRQIITYRFLKFRFGEKFKVSNGHKMIAFD